MNPGAPRLASVISAPFAENTYVLWREGGGDCIVVDPGMEPDKIFALLDEHGLTPTAILLTHGHADHIAGNGALKERWPDCPLVIGTREANKLIDPWENLSATFGYRLVSPPADVLVNEGDVYQAAGFACEVYDLPGHSTGHVVYVVRGQQPTFVLAGDTLMAGSIGRTDFPGGSFELLNAGIQQKIFTLPDDTLVLSGHGPGTTVGREKVSNPFVGQAAGTYPLD